MKEIDYNLGNLNYYKNEYDQAISHYNEALKTKDKFLKSNTHFNLGNTYYKLDDYEKIAELALMWNNGYNLYKDNYFKNLSCMNHLPRLCFYWKYVQQNW